MRQLSVVRQYHFSLVIIVVYSFTSGVSFQPFMEVTDIKANTVDKLLEGYSCSMTCYHNVVIILSKLGFPMSVTEVLIMFLGGTQIHDRIFFFIIFILFSCSFFGVSS